MAGEDWFDIDPRIFREALVDAYVRHRDDPVVRPLRIYARNPTARRREGALAVVPIPYEPLERGPEGRVVQVVDFDATTGKTAPPVDLDRPEALLNAGFKPSLADPAFRQQMVYAVAMETWHSFRQALGRDPGWGFKSQEPGPHKLRIRPYALADMNAYYDGEAGELVFGYYRAQQASGRNLPEGMVMTSLSHDIVAHETTHALLDGLRPHYMAMTHPDVPAFHEAFGDLIAILMKFRYPELVQTAIERKPEAPLTDRTLAWMATQFGQTLTGEDQPLRCGIEIADPEDSPGDLPGDSNIRVYDPNLECHQLGSILVSAVFEAFSQVYENRIKPYRQMIARYRSPGMALDPDLAHIMAREANKVADHFLALCIRAVDYCPPVDITFGDYLRALITADFDLVPHDRYGYRDQLIDAFARRRIFPNPDQVLNMSEDALLWEMPEPDLPPIPGLSFAELRFQGDPGRPMSNAELQRQAEALGRFIRQPAHMEALRLLEPDNEALGEDRVSPPIISSIRSLRRIGPDKHAKFGMAAEIIQHRYPAGTGNRLHRITGGSTLVIGSDGKIRYVIYKPLHKMEVVARQTSFALKAGRRYWTGRKGIFKPWPDNLRRIHKEKRRQSQTRTK